MVWTGPGLLDTHLLPISERVYTCSKLMMTCTIRVYYGIWAVPGLQSASMIRF